MKKFNYFNLTNNNKPTFQKINKILLFILFVLFLFILAIGTYKIAGGHDNFITNVNDGIADSISSSAI